ncbi:MAG TPA: F0F1 ATP synthase subunit B [Candidatus Paceibacterota bacterium]
MSELFSNLGIDIRLLIAQTVNFLLVLFLLKKFVFGKVIRHLEERRTRIEQGLELTEKAKREMGRIEESRHRELEKARVAGEKVLADARGSAAEKEKAALVLVRVEAEKMLQKAKAEAAKEKTDAVRGAQSESQKLAVLMAEKILGRSVTREDQDRAAKEVMEYFEKNYAKQS